MGQTIQTKADSSGQYKGKYIPDTAPIKEDEENEIGILEAKCRELEKRLNSAKTDDGRGAAYSMLYGERGIASTLLKKGARRLAVIYDEKGDAKNAAYFLLKTAWAEAKCPVDMDHASDYLGAGLESMEKLKQSDFSKERWKNVQNCATNLKELYDELNKTISKDFEDERAGKASPFITMNQKFVEKLISALEQAMAAIGK